MDKNRQAEYNQAFCFRGRIENGSHRNIATAMNVTKIKYEPYNHPSNPAYIGTRKLSHRMSAREPGIETSSQWMNSVRRTNGTASDSLNKEKKIANNDAKDSRAMNTPAHRFIAIEAGVTRWK